MKPADIRDYLDREWELVRDLKDRYWAERKPSLTPDAALRVGDGLREHAQSLRPEWPDAAEREVDIRVHARVSGNLRCVRFARG